MRPAGWLAPIRRYCNPRLDDIGRYFNDLDLVIADNYRIASPETLVDMLVQFDIGCATFQRCIAYRANHRILQTVSEVIAELFTR